MALIDHQKEQQRLAAFYASKTDMELAEFARDQGNLTEDALRVLESEFSRRGLHFERQNLAPTANQEDVKLVAVRRYRDVPEALLAKGRLDSESIKCFLSDENTLAMNWMWSNALGGVRLWVKEEDVPRATEMLDLDFQTSQNLRIPATTNSGS